MNPEEELKAKIAALESDKQALVGELTDNRPKLREKDEAIELLKEQLRLAVEKNNANPEDAKITEAVEKLLSQKEAERAQANKKVAFDKFVTEHTEYHPDNDVGGIKQTALREKFARFNTDGLATTEDFQKVIGDAHALLRGFDTPRQTSTHVPSTPSSAGAPASTVTSELTPLEEKILERNNWTTERYLELKEKFPDLIENALASAR